MQICFAIFFAVRALQERIRIASLYNERLFDLPPEVASRFVEDMRAFLIEKDAFKRDEIATRQLRALRQYQRSREKELCLADQANISGLDRTSMTGIDHMIIGIDGLRAGLACERIRKRIFVNGIILPMRGSAFTRKIAERRWCKATGAVASDATSIRQEAGEC